jgi:hypothetical protein
MRALIFFAIFEGKRSVPDEDRGALEHWSKAYGFVRRRSAERGTKRFAGNERLRFRCPPILNQVDYGEKRARADEPSVVLMG